MIMLRPCTVGLALSIAASLLFSPPRGRAQTLPAPVAPHPTTAAAPAHSSKAHSKKPVPAVEVPQVPAAPPTLEEQPPAAPQVTYSNGQLSITSTNATLSQVLRSVQMQTGASVDMPPGAGSERVVATLGPGKPKDVLASLLNGSKFNYVILGESGSSGAVQKVILLAKTSAGADTSNTVAQNSLRPPQQPQAVEQPEDDPAQNEPEAEIQNQPVPGQVIPPNGDPAGSDGQVMSPGNRTPEQMLQELQRLQQQQQQQQQQLQQQLNPANQPTQPLTPGRPPGVQPQ